MEQRHQNSHEILRNLGLKPFLGLSSKVNIHIFSGIILAQNFMRENDLSWPKFVRNFAFSKRDLDTIHY